MKKLVSLLLTGIFTLGTGTLQANTSTVNEPLEPVAVVETLAVNASTYVCEIGGCTQTTEHTNNVCREKSCTANGAHQHGGIYYYPHSKKDGHSYHSEVPGCHCMVSGCTDTSKHGHPVCPIRHCSITDSHQHDGAYYLGHHENDGHGHGYATQAQAAQPRHQAQNCVLAGCSQTGEHSHTTCGVANCTVTGTHDHGSTLYYGHDDGDGHGHGGNGACSVAGCTQTGNYSHNEGIAHNNTEKRYGGNHH